MSYANYANRSSSEKLTLCWIEPAQRLKVWTLDTGAVYKKTVSHFVVDTYDGTTQLTAGASSTLNAGEWYYNPETSVLYVRMSDDSNPDNAGIVATYRKFYASAPIDLPYDLSSGVDVHYEGALNSASAVTKELDYEQTGVALESSTNLKLENRSGLFDDIYDTLVWENKAVKVYSWNEDIALSEKQLLFDGIIENKTFSTSSVGFSCKDFVYKLRQPLNMGLFTTSDGSLSDFDLNKPKRRIYGKVDNVKCVGLDKTLDGFTLTGTIAGTQAATTVTGTGTAFLDECSPSDQIVITFNNEEYVYNIESVDSDVQLTLNDEIEFDFTGETVKNRPDRPWRKKNRTWHIAGHKLRAPSTTVNVGSQPNRFTVADGTDLFADDVIEVGGESAIIKRITDSSIVLEANLQGGTPANGDTVTKNPVSKAYFGGEEIFIDRDFTITNTTEAKIVLTNTVERDLARTRKLPGTITFTNASRQVTATGVDLVNELKPRDWIRSSDISHTTWYEVLSVAEGEIYLRTAYAGANKTDTSAEKKNTHLIGDDALITVNCIGMEYSGNWIRTASDAVNHLLVNDAILTNTNAASFTQADIDAPYSLSMVLPERIGGSIPKIKNVITKINESVFGSLFNNSDWELVYNVLTPEKPEDIEKIEDHDIIGEISVLSRNQIIRKVNANYRPFVDRFTGEDTFKLYEFESDFVDELVGLKSEKEVTLYLYEDEDAQEIAQRIALYNSLSQSVVKVKGKLNFALKNLNDKLYLNLERLYKRFGGFDRKKIGMISKISKSGSDTSLELIDHGNVFTRVMSIAPNTANDFSSATEDEKLTNGFIVDNNTLTPDTTDDSFADCNIIG